MKKLVILILTALLLTSCSKGEVMVEPSEEPEAAYCYVGDILQFSSEEATFEYVIDESGESMGIQSANDGSSTYRYLHYYKFKMLPEGAVINGIDFELGGDASVFYDTQKGDVKGEILTIKHFQHEHYDVESRSFWVNRKFPEESHIFEVEEVKYYIAKWTSGSEFLWVAEWVNADSYYMVSQFPYSFTAEEVLGYISDLERVDIAVPEAGDEAD